MTILDGKDPRFFFSVITFDDRWMIAHGKDGKPVIEAGFVGSKEDADAIAGAWNKQELDYYKSESAKAPLKQVSGRRFWKLPDRSE